MFVDLRALRNDRVTLVERGAPHSLCLMESGKLLPGVKVIIANPETKGHCGDSNLGEVSGRAQRWRRGCGLGSRHAGQKWGTWVCTCVCDGVGGNGHGERWGTIIGGV